MKKLTIIGLAVCLAFALAAPATAVDVDFSGNYYVRGFYTEHWDLDEDSASNAYMDMRFRLQTVFKVNDILSVTTRFDALDKVWGDADNPTTTAVGVGTPTAATYTTDPQNNIDFDRAYMTIKVPIGTFIIGRQKAFAWGTSFIDNEGEADRIKYVKKIDNLKLIAIFQKNAENDIATFDAGPPIVPDSADLDSENYYLAGIYKMENITAGLLGFFRNDKTVDTQTTHEYGLIPYIVAKFGPLDIQGELRYDWGQTEFDSVAAGGTGDPDLDIKELAYNLEATYNFGPASVMAGYAFVSGDGDGNADDEDSAYGGVGNDWEKLFILTYDEFPVNALGGIGNLSAGLASGAKIIYGGATFSPLDNLELGVVIGKAEADELTAGFEEDDYGLEYDFTLNWKIYDNLTYTAIVAFLNAGDFYKEQSAIPSADFDDTYALFHQLQLSF